jgi:hypothetical protein
MRFPGGPISIRKTNKTKAESLHLCLICIVYYLLSLNVYLHECWSKHNNNFNNNLHNNRGIGKRPQQLVPLESELVDSRGG